MVNWIREFINTLRSVFGLSRKQRELDIEMSFHIEEMIDDLMEQGMNREEAHKAALKEFGGVEQIKEECRESWGINVLVNVVNNFLFGLRISIRNRSSSLLSILVLSLGIGISTMMYTVFSKVLDMSAGADLNERHLFVQWETGQPGGLAINSFDFKFIRDEAKSFEKFVGIQVLGGWFHLPGKRADRERYTGGFVSSNFFDLANTNPQIGRVFSQQGSNEDLVREVVISDVVWDDFYSRDKEILGSILMVNDEECVVVGVMPVGFAFPQNLQFWIATDWRGMESSNRASAPNLTAVVGELKEGLNKNEASSELGVIASNLTTSFPMVNMKLERFRLTSFQEKFTSPGAIAILTIGIGISFLVLMLACSNVFHIIVSRTTARAHELAVRCSLGAQRRNVIFQILIDGLILSGLGAVLGILLAQRGLNYLTQYLTYFKGHPGLNGFPLNFDVILFSVGAAVVAGVAASLIPALRASKIEIFGILKDDTKSTSSIYVGRLSKIIVISQVGFSSLLIFICLVVNTLVWGYWAKILDFPFDDKTVLSTVVINESGRFGAGENGSQEKFYKELHSRFSEVPGVRAVALTNAQLGVGNTGESILIEDREDVLPADRAQVNLVTPSLLEVYGVNVLSGRMINDGDILQSANVCVVDSDFVDVYCKGSNAVGMRLKVRGAKESEDPGWTTVVGVIPNLKSMMPFPPKGNIMIPYTRRQGWVPTVLVGTEGTGGGNYRRATREIIQAVVPEARVFGGILTIKERLDVVFGVLNTVLTVGAIFGGAILVMSLVGLYSIIEFTNFQRQKEFGIRMAVGANSFDIAISVIKPWLITIGAGLTIGFIGAMGLPYAINSFIGEGVSAIGDQITVTNLLIKPYVWTILLICVTCLVGMGVPCLRALKTKPMEVMGVK